MNQMFFGNARVMLFAPNGGSTPPAEPSPYFTYDSNRVITGLYQGSPNNYVEGTYEGNNPNIWEWVDIPYSGWTYGGSNLTDNYALGIANWTFDDSNYTDMGVPPSKGVSGSLSFPNVTSIGDAAFYYCISLNSISLPNVTSIGDYAFYNCSGLNSISLPNVTSIGKYAFNYCTSLNSISLPNVTSIGKYAFYYCSSLTSVTIGSNFETIEEYAFETEGNPITLTIDKPISWVSTRYGNWYLPSGSTIVCTGGDTIDTISIP